jgi:hypothetical protein
MRAGLRSRDGSRPGVDRHSRRLWRNEIAVYPQTLSSTGGEMMQSVPLDVLPYSEFGRMRLGSFVPPGAEIVEQSNFEWMGGLWLHEGIGFTWFGRLMAQSDQTGGLEILFEELDEASIERILRFLRLPLRPGMKTEKLHDLLGCPSTTNVFTSDRRTYNFRVGQGNEYQVSCTVQDEGGLIHVAVIRSDVHRHLALAAENES